MNLVESLNCPAPLWLKLAILLCVVLSAWLTYQRCLRRLHPQCIAWVGGSLIGTLAINTALALVENKYGLLNFACSIVLWWWLLLVPGGLTAAAARLCWRKLITQMSTRKVVGCARHGTREFPIFERRSEPKLNFGPEEEVIFLASCFFGLPGAVGAAIVCCGIVGACLDAIYRLASVSLASL